jgi:PTS system glucitol/sorbitol-specific IIA component
MSKQKYHARVTAIGEIADEFIAEGVIVFFAATAPEELQEVALVHDQTDPQTEDVQAGDTIRLGDKTYSVLAVGPVANENLRSLGHLVLKFNGLEEPEMQGDVNLPNETIPEISVGIELEILGD